jgi:Icc-related predicted phosphoesterase
MEIALTKMQYIAEELKENERKLQTQATEIEEVEQVLTHMQEEGIRGVRRKLQQQKETLYQEQYKLQQLRKCLEKVITLYGKCEQNIVDSDTIVQISTPKFESYQLKDLSWKLHTYQLRFK